MDPGEDEATISSAVTALFYRFESPQLNGAADKRCQCVFAHLAALRTQQVFFSSKLLHEEKRHMGATACVNKVLSKTTIP